MLTIRNWLLALATGLALTACGGPSKTPYQPTRERKATPSRNEPVIPILADPMEREEEPDPPDPHRKPDDAEKQPKNPPPPKEKEQGPPPGTE